MHMDACMLSHFSRVWLCTILWIIACQASLSMAFTRQEHWSGLPCPPPKDLPDPDMEPASLMSPALAGRFFITSATWEAHVYGPSIFHKDGEALLQSAKTRPGADCASDDEPLIAKFRLKLKKVGKTTRPSGMTWIKSLTVEVTNRFKRLDLIECLKNYGQRFMTLYRRQLSRPYPRKRNAKRQNGCLRRPYKQLWKEEKGKAKEKRKDIPIWMQSSKEQQGERKPSSAINAKK